MVTIPVVENITNVTSVCNVAYSRVHDFKRGYDSVSALIGGQIVSGKIYTCYYCADAKFFVPDLWKEEYVGLRIALT